MGKSVVKKVLQVLLVVSFIIAAVPTPVLSVHDVPSPRSRSDSAWWRANATASALQSIWYNPTCQPSCWTAGIFWTDANELETLMNFKAAAASQPHGASENWTQVLEPVVIDIYETQNVIPLTGLIPAFDDALWWGLAWLRAYQEYAQSSYLERSVEILKAVYEQAWDPSTCGGGLWWNPSRDYKNAITNELFIALAAALAVQTGNPTTAEWAEQVHRYMVASFSGYNWFVQSGMLNSQNLFNDGLNASCQNNGQTTWTYNQGVILGASASLYKLTNDSNYLTYAHAVATAALTYLVHPGGDGVLMDVCDTDPGGCNNDGSQFKGIFVRHLFYFTKVWESATGKPVPWRKRMTKMADVMWRQARASSTSLEFGENWVGPFNGASPIRQGSALDLLLYAATTFEFN